MQARTFLDRDSDAQANKQPVCDQPEDDSMATTQQNPIDIIAEHEEIFQTIEAEADDPLVAKKFGRQPLRLLELDRERGGQA